MSHRIMDLNRFKKIYPLMRRSPRFIDTSSDVEAFTVEFTQAEGVLTKDHTLQRGYPSVPADAVSVQNANVNAFVSAITESNGLYVVSIVISHLPSASTPIIVHGHAAEIPV